MRTTRHINTISGTDDVFEMDFRRDPNARGVLKRIAKSRRCTVANISILLKRGNPKVLSLFAQYYNENKAARAAAEQEVRDAIAA
ncbi:MAG: hypothetical protein JNL32_02320 [Candidatus Kapabacteria bacterium]|nr:hypothetical protein [Candidatus Kapabacteria bacterium]